MGFVTEGKGRSGIDRWRRVALVSRVAAEAWLIEVERFVLRVRDLDPGVSTRPFELSPSWMEAQTEGLDGIAPSDEPGSVELEVDRHGQEVLLRGTVRATLKVRCVRCLEDVAFPVEAELEALMLPGSTTAKKKKKADDEDEEDELGVERYLGGEIVLDDLIRDMILLEVPMNPDCGSECPGWERLRQT